MAPDSGGLPTVREAPTGLAKRFFEALRPEIRDGLTDQQRDALIAAAQDLGWNRHPTDIRVSVPFFKKRFYLVFLAGEERRDRARVRAERESRPLGTAANLMLLGLLSVASTFVGGFLFTLILISYLSF